MEDNRQSDTGAGVSQEVVERNQKVIRKMMSGRRTSQKIRKARWKATGHQVVP